MEEEEEGKVTQRKDFSKRVQSAYPIGLAKYNSNKKQTKVQIVSNDDYIVENKDGYDHRQRPSTAFTTLRNTKKEIRLGSEPDRKIVLRKESGNLTRKGEIKLEMQLAYDFDYLNTDRPNLLKEIEKNKSYDRTKLNRAASAKVCTLKNLAKGPDEPFYAQVDQVARYFDKNLQ